MNKEYTIRDLYEIYCEAMPRYPLTYECFRDILHRDNSQIFTAENSETIIGFVVVNGFNLGRYYNDAGPQKTLYCPAPMLKKGKNEIIVFEMDSSDRNEIEFTDTPDLG